MENDAAYATHLDFLTRLGPGVRTVLELGAGKYSTSLFLNRDVYPDLTQLVSVEHVREWIELLPQDPRLMTIIVEDPATSVLPHLGEVKFDLVFVDNSPCEYREKAILWLKAHTRGVKIVIHDFEYDAYQVAAEGFAHIEVDKTLVPWTAMVWND